MLTSIEQRIVFERDDCSRDRIERIAAVGENFATCGQGTAQTVMV
jgi:hypothetical protein